MAYDRGYREHQHGRRRGPELDYGWGVPIRGMYDYSLDYGGLAGPESEDSETIPPYETGPDDWTGPRPRYERDHWAAAEPAGERRYREAVRGRGRRGGYAREFGRSALDAARARAHVGYGGAYSYDREYRGGGEFAGRGEWPPRQGRWDGFGPARSFGGRPGRPGRPGTRRGAGPDDFRERYAAPGEWGRGWPGSGRARGGAGERAWPGTRADPGSSPGEREWPEARRRRGWPEGGGSGWGPAHRDERAPYDVARESAFYRGRRPRGRRGRFGEG